MLGHSELTLRVILMLDTSNVMLPSWLTNQIKSNKAPSGTRLAVHQSDAP